MVLETQEEKETLIADGWEEKDWGWTRCKHKATPRYTLHELKTKEGGFCSFHYHNERGNVFRVLAGLVRVVWVFGWRIEHQLLSKDNSLFIPSLVPHQFQVLESGEMWEEYVPDRSGGRVSVDDIERLTRGGMTELSKLRRAPGIVSQHQVHEIAWHDLITVV